MAAALVAVAAVSVAGAVLLGSEATPVAVEPNSVAVIDPETNDVIDTIQAGILPGPITAGGGWVWAANLNDKSVTQIGQDSRDVVKTVTLAATPTGIAFGHGHLWAAHGLTGQVTQVDPELGVQEPVDVAETMRRSSDGAVAAGPSGVWAVFGDGTMAKLDPTSGSVERDVIEALNRPTAVIEAGGIVWVVSSGDSTVYRFNPPTVPGRPSRRHRTLVGDRRASRTASVQPGSRAVETAT